MLSHMRTTVTLDADTEQLLRRRMAEQKISFKQALNEAVRAGLCRPEQEPFRTKTTNLGAARVDLTKALQVAGELEDAEIIRKMRSGK